MEKSELFEGLMGRAVPADQEQNITGDGNSIDPNRNSTPSVTFAVVFSTLVALCGAYAFGNAVGYSSPAQNGIMEDLGLSLAEYAVFGSASTVGGMLGALFSGQISDLVGRRAAMGISDIFFITGWLAIAFSKDAFWLDLGRFVMGCGAGVMVYVVPVYIAEITTKNIRGAFTALNILMLTSGKATMYVIASLINWRTSALIGGIPCLLQLLGVFLIPESPRLLAKTNRTKEFESALQRLRGEQADISQEATDILEYTEYHQQISHGGIRDLFQRKYINPMIVGVGLMVFQQTSGLNGFSFYASFIFESAGFNGTVGSIAVAVLQISMSTMGVLFIDKSGRRPLLLISSTGTCLGSFITGLSFLLQNLHAGRGFTSTLALTGVMVFMLSFDLGMGGIPWTIVSEIFPVNVRGTAGSLVNFINWTASWAVAYTFPFLFQWNSSGIFFIYAFMGVAAIVFIAKLVPETKGRTLEEIQVSMTKNLQ